MRASWTIWFVVFVLAMLALVGSISLELYS